MGGSTGHDLRLLPEAQAAGGVVKGPNTVAPDRYVYYPGTEVLAKDEVRVIACGTGMPAARRGQAATCFLVETGNGDKFIFDIGSGSMANLAALMIPYQYLDKVFLSHLHTDHMGDIDGLWAGGWTAGRPNALKVWGPSGMTPELGTKYSMDNFLKHANWDYTTRKFNIAAVPGNIETTEFDYKGVNQVVYQENGVTIRSWPAVHAGDGPISYSLEYSGLKVVIGGDTFPNKWFLKYAKDADLAIHEAFMAPGLFVTLYGQPPQLAWRACCAFHTSGQAFGKVMSEIKPRQAVAYHFLNEVATRYSLYDNIRETYDGPLSMAADMMVWNITKDKVTERMAVSTEEAWAVLGTARQPPPKKGQPPVFSKFILDGRWDEGAQPAQKKMLDEFAEKYGLQDQDWRKQMKK
ncbi:MAG: guanitoxin biosynthesis MBL fold metallo-hydrolase GntH [Alphaproteobacteria bacterium]|nr:guanitoxin biosynthesis MBL fold metallo-hydrolase GntH [Alphaproteobacteria bacterium]